MRIGFWLRRPEGYRPPGRPRRRWEDDIKMDFLIRGRDAWTESVLLRTETGVGLFRMR